MEKATCYIVDDEILAIERLDRLVKLNNQIQLLGNNTSPLIALDEIKQLQPDLVFIDVEMPGLSGFEMMEEIRDEGLHPAFIMVTAFDQYAIKSLRAEALDYLEKPVDVDDLNHAITHFYKKHRQSSIIPKSWALTEREVEVLEFLLQGLSSKQIAAKLYLSHHTIDTYRRNILEKSSCKTTGELIAHLSL